MHCLVTSVGQSTLGFSPQGVQLFRMRFTCMHIKDEPGCSWTTWRNWPSPPSPWTSPFQFPGQKSGLDSLCSVIEVWWEPTPISKATAVGWREMKSNRGWLQPLGTTDLPLGDKHFSPFMVLSICGPCLCCYHYHRIAWGLGYQVTEKRKMWKIFCTCSEH